MRSVETLHTLILAFRHAVMHCLSPLLYLKYNINTITPLTAALMGLNVPARLQARGIGHISDAQTAQPRSPVNSLAASDTVDHCFMGFVFFSLSLHGVQRRTGAGLLQSTSVQIPQWNLCGASRIKRRRPRTPPTRAYTRRPVHQLAVFEMFESYFIRCVCAQAGWMDEPDPPLPPHPPGLMLKGQSHFCGGVWGMRGALRGVVNQAFLKSLWRRGASGCPHRIIRAWTGTGTGNGTGTGHLLPPLYCKKIPVRNGWKKDSFYFFNTDFSTRPLKKTNDLFYHKLLAICRVFSQRQQLGLSKPKWPLWTHPSNIIWH